MQKLEYKQIADFLNQSTKEVIGEESTIVNEDLSNIVDFGVEVANLGKTNALLDDFVGRIARVIFYDRTYGIRTDLGIYRDNIEYGLTLQRMSVDELPESEDNPTWQLEDGVSIDPFVVKLPKAKARYFEKRNTAEIDMTILEKQYKSAFVSAENLSRFVGMIFNAVDNSKAIKVNNLIKAVLRAAMSINIYSSKQVKLITLYNTSMGYTSSDTGYVDPTDPESALYNKEFLRFASMIINDYTRAITEMSTLYNEEGVPRFTPADSRHLVVLGKFADACQYYLEADTYHNNLVSMPGYTTMDAWQNTPSRSFDKLSQIDVTNDDGHRVQQGAIVGALYDGDGMAVTVENPRINSIYNPKGEYLNYFHKFDWASAVFKDMNFITFVLE